jgi:putative oxidoreductase
MNTALWIAQGLFGAMFIMAGIVKSTQSKEKLSTRMPWVNDYSATQVKLIGLSELLGGIGLILPWYLGIVPILTPIAAVGLAIIMVLAAVYHFGKKEYSGIGVNLFLLAGTVFIAYGRF